MSIISDTSEIFSFRCLFCLDDVHEGVTNLVREHFTCVCEIGNCTTPAHQNKEVGFAHFFSICKLKTLNKGKKIKKGIKLNEIEKIDTIIKILTNKKI